MHGEHFPVSPSQFNVALFSKIREAASRMNSSDDGDPVDINIAVGFFDFSTNCEEKLIRLYGDGELLLVIIRNVTRLYFLLQLAGCFSFGLNGTDEVQRDGSIVVDALFMIRREGGRGQSGKSDRQVISRAQMVLRRVHFPRTGIARP